MTAPSAPRPGTRRALLTTDQVLNGLLGLTMIVIGGWLQADVTAFGLRCVTASGQVTAQYEETVRDSDGRPRTTLRSTIVFRRTDGSRGEFSRTLPGKRIGDRLTICYDPQDQRRAEAGSRWRQFSLWGLFFGALGAFLLVTQSLGPAIRARRRRPPSPAPLALGTPPGKTPVERLLLAGLWDVPATRAQVWLRTPGRDDVTRVSLDRQARTATTTSPLAGPERTLWSSVVDTGRRVRLAPDTEEIHQLPFLSLHGAGSVLAVPIALTGRRVGLLLAADPPNAGAFDHADLDALARSVDSLADQNLAELWAVVDGRRDASPDRP